MCLNCILGPNYSCEGMTANECQVLVLGAEGSGKTLLLKRIQSAIENGTDKKDDFEAVPSTVSTIGTNIASVTMNKKKINIRELGGAMAPIWKNFYDDSNAVIFLIDISNSFQVASSTVLFLDVLSSRNLSDLPILLLLNKTDLDSSLTIQEIKFILRLNDLKKHATKKLKVIECSLKSGTGIEEIKDWLQQL